MENFQFLEAKAYLKAIPLPTQLILLTTIFTANIYMLEQAL